MSKRKKAREDSVEQASMEVTNKHPLAMRVDIMEEFLKGCPDIDIKKMVEDGRQIAGSEDALAEVVWTSAVKQLYQKFLEANFREDTLDACRLCGTIHDLLRLKETKLLEFVCDPKCERKLDKDKALAQLEEKHAEMSKR